MKIPALKCLAILALSLISAGGFAAEEKSPPDPESTCVALEKRKGHEEGDAKTICHNLKKHQSRIYVKPPKEPVEMTVGSPPMFSDDTDTPGPGNWEINVVVSGDIARDNSSFDVPLLDINYGVGEEVQLKFEVPYVVRRATEHDDAGVGTTSTFQGIANTSVGLKYRFYDNKDSGLSLAVFPQVEFRTPGAVLEAEGGAATPGTVVKVPVLLTWEFDRVSLTANARIEESSEEPRFEYFASFGVGTRLNDKWAILGEIAGRGLGRSDDRRFLLNIGLRRKFSEKHLLVGSAGGDILTGGDGPKHLYFTVAYQRLIGRKK